jgi:hypothetical protein
MLNPSRRETAVTLQPAGLKDLEEEIFFGHKDPMHEKTDGLQRKTVTFLWLSCRF